MVQRKLLRELQRRNELLRGEYQPGGRLKRHIVNESAVTALKLAQSLDPVEKDNE